MACNFIPGGIVLWTFLFANCPMSGPVDAAEAKLDIFTDSTGPTDVQLLNFLPHVCHAKMESLNESKIHKYVCFSRGSRDNSIMMVSIVF